MTMSPVLPIVVAAAALIPAAVLAQSAPTDRVKRGEYLVTIGGCHDCHTPLVMGSNGPEPDMKRALSGHPQDIAIRGPTPLPEPWMAAFAPTMTAVTGPWGVSFSANLTPDPETGVLRDFTEQQFIQTLRTGRPQGQGRPILPPMPWQNFGQMTDEDLRSVFAYLRQIPPVKNKVPDPIIAAK